MMKRLLLVSMLLLSGCGLHVKHGGRGFMPVLPKPARPRLTGLTEDEKVAVKKMPQAVVNKTSQNFQQLHLYVAQLEAAIKLYNEYAETNNALVRQDLGLPFAKKPDNVKAKKAAREPKKATKVEAEKNLWWRKDNGS